jgi:hypothetical protein
VLGGGAGTSALGKGEGQKTVLEEGRRQCWRGVGQIKVFSTLIEMLGEFFLIYDEGRRCKVIYDENIFPVYDGKLP